MKTVLERRLALFLSDKLLGLLLVVVPVLYRLFECKVNINRS